MVRSTGRPPLLPKSGWVFHLRWADGYGCLYTLFVVTAVLVIALLIAGFLAGWSYVEIPDQMEIFPL